MKNSISTHHLLNYFKKQQLWFILLLVSAHSVSAQTTTTITLNIENATIEEIINTIEEKSEYHFLYNKELVDVTSRVSIKVVNQPLAQVLKTLFFKKNISYIIDGRQIVLSQKEKIKPGKIKTVEGKVIDQSGEPIIGANIMIKGTDMGATTNMDGDFSLEVLDKAILHVSYIGYESKDIKVTGKEFLNIQMNEDAKALEEVVVVGYGTQKKVNLTGSVVSVGADVLSARPIANVTTGLQGALPGVTIINSSSRPGDSNTTIRVRGIGTLNNSNPLILIDGVEGNMNTINPDDIESVSVLKDAASSSIYGSRAANGVVLVTTKKASKEAKTTINYTGYFAFQTPTTQPEILDAVTYLTLLKEATSNVGKSWGYTQDDIDAVINNTDPNYRANTNWLDALTKKYASQMGHNVSLNGGGKSLGYYMSYGNLTTDGLLVGDGYKSARNNARLKINATLFKRLSIEANVGYSDVDNWTPAAADSGDGGLFYQALRSSPLVPIKFSDGKWGYGGSSANPVAIAYDGGFINYRMQETSLNTSANFNVLDGFDIKVQYAIRQQNGLRKQQRNIIQHFYPDTDIPLAYSSNTSLINQRDIVSEYQNLTIQGDYEKTFGQHTIRLLGGFSQEWQLYQQSDTGRENLVSDELHVIDAGTGIQTNSGNATHWAIRSGLGRINYNFADRYLFEANIRYDLSSRFHKRNRGGCFPSASVAWRITEESFMEPLRELINNLKLRISYGTLGNQYTTSLYPYMSTIEPSLSMMPIGGSITSSMQQNMASNNILSWESINMFNIGLDYAMFNNRLSLTLDYFIKDTEGILLKVKLPDVLGVSEPYQNAGKVQNKGWELAMSWQDKIGNDFHYGVNLNLSDVVNNVVSVGNTVSDFSGTQIRAVGYPIDAFWGYEAEGLYAVSDFDYDAGTNTYTPKKTTPIIEAYRTKVQPGDIKYKDLNKDGEITSTDDRTYIGSPIPRFTYGIGLNAGWKGIDFSMFWQGVGQCDGYIGGMGRHTFTGLANYPQKAHLDRWTWENQNANASYPRFTYEETYNSDEFSSFWIEDASYLRLKNVQLGYTIPNNNFFKKICIDKLRVYFSGENLCTITNYFSSYDPETPVSNGGFYPLTASYSLGLSLTFR